MSDIKLYAIQPEVRELQALELSLEKSIQTIIEKNMDLFFGVTFLKSGYQTANGRIDSIGIDENNCPVVFEYKQSINENVINQGLFYLDWLLDHKADFKLLIMETLGSQAAVKIDWSRPCIICIADDFTKFDEHAVNQMKRNIKLVRYRYYNTFLLLEHLNAPNVKPFAYSPKNINNTSVSERSEITFDGQYRNASEQLKTLYRKKEIMYFLLEMKLPRTSSSST